MNIRNKRIECWRKGDILLQKNKIEIKGLKGRFVVLFSDDVTLYTAISLLDEKLSSNRDFFRDAVFQEIEGKSLSQNDKLIISEFMREHYAIDLRALTKAKEIAIPEVKSDVPLQDEPRKTKEEGYQKTKFVFETLRSGALVQFDGHVVIVGDVNPGARVQATGNIIILGTLRGIAHAGSSGNKETFVFAERLMPIQLRISNSIAITPENDKKIEEPLIARIKDDNILIESCLSRR